VSGELSFDYQYEAGRVRDTVFQVGVRADPALDRVDSFAVVLFFQLDDGTVVEVAKVDDTVHDDGEIHVDRYYRDRFEKDFDVGIDGVWDAEEYLRNRWRRYARTYLRNFGRGPRRE
jgi:hypothetical protein